MGKNEELKKARKEVEACIKCGLWLERIQPVFGEGNVDADIMLVGEGPGSSEDQTGHPFVGRAGQLLSKILKWVDLERKDIYICNIVKCRPPNNRNPKPKEVEACIGYLDRQIEIIEPKAIVLLGAVALKALFKDNSLSIKRNRGNWREYKNIPVMPTFHPAFLLRQMTEENKNAVKNDLNLVIKKIEK